MKHLSSDERVALAEAPGEPSHPHLAACRDCRQQVEALRVVLGEARSVDAPEPSPLFWQHFSARVSARLAEQPPARRDWRTAWRVLVPLAVGAMGLVIAVAIHRETPPVVPVVAPAASVALSRGAEPDAVVEDEAWSVLESLAGDFDIDTLGDSLAHPMSGSAESAVWNMNDAERVELGRLLKAELRPARKSSE